MRTILCHAAALAMLALAWSAGAATPVQTKKTAPKKGTASAHKGGKKGTARTATWRNRQMQPTLDRYREIQSALVAKGYLPLEQATGKWDQTSTDALKRFQQDQKIESTGKINSLSLIALGLGPKRESVPALPPPAPAPAPPKNDGK